MAIRILLAVAVLGLLVSECVWGQANAPEPAIARIFNGKDLTGWKGNKGYWSVKDGAIVGHSDKNVARNEFIWSDVEVQDFYLAVDVKLVPGDRNAGIQFRSKPVDTHGQALGYQADVGHDQVIGNVWGNLYHEHGRGKLDWNDRAVQVLKSGDWNRYEILAVGHRVWTAINGKLCVAIEDPEGELSGKIAFQIHGGPPQTVHYRNPTLTHNPKMELAGLSEKELLAELPKKELPYWSKLIAGVDPGSQNEAWANPTFNHSKWKTMKVPGHFDTVELPGFDGVVWFRKTIELSVEQAKAAATLNLGQIDDMDVTWVNGTRVGGYENPGHHYTVRNYPIPAGVLKPGKNVIAVRVMDHGAPGGIAGKPEQLFLQLDDERESLANLWHYAPGANLAALNKYSQIPPLLRPLSRPKSPVSAFPDGFSINRDQMIVVLGGTNALESGRHGYLETLLVAAHPQQKVRVRNLAWQADTVYEQQRPRNFYAASKPDYGERDGRAKIEADIVVFWMGQTESLDGPERVDDFVAACKQHLDQIAAYTKRIVLVTPIPFSNPLQLEIDIRKRNDSLAVYVDAIRKIGRERKLPVVDLYGSLTLRVEHAANGLDSESQATVSRNGLHLSSAGHWFVARAFASQLGYSNRVASIKWCDANEGDKHGLEPASAESLRNAIRQKNDLWFRYWRPTNWAFLYGNRQSTPSSRDHTNPSRRWFPEELKNALPQLDKAEMRVHEAAQANNRANARADESNAQADDVVQQARRLNSVAAELKSFAMADGYEANLFADEADGVANPVCMSWDPAGRLWVLVTAAYPQLKPVDNPNDKLLILTDTNGDGRADKTIVFADGLNMPTGFALGHGGAYIGQGSDLLHLEDTDGDDKADTRRVLLTGFGTGDTHQNINSFTWSPGGELFFCQGLHSFSRVETPWGIRRLDEHGSWRLRPRRLQLHGFRRSGGDGNPWGIAFGNWGEPFVKGNGQGVFELLPGMVSTDRIASFWGREMRIGQTQVKSMIIELAESPHLPGDIQGEMLIAGYFARDVNRFQWEPDESGHRLNPQPNLMTSSHNAFRPVDIRIGPDGAIYIADWFNPIIGHYQASFRHPDRDKTHGRIWRITAKGRPLANAPDLSKAGAAELCEHLKSGWRYVRLQAKRRLADLPKSEVIPVVQKWVDELDSNDPNLEHHLFEAIGVFESHEFVNRPLLESLLEANDYRARAYATRVAGRWHDRLEEPLDLLRRSITDEHARVRLEAIVACSDIPTADSMAVAAKAVDRATDRFTNHALTQTVHALAPHWRPALNQGELGFDNPAGLIYVLQAFGGKDVAGQVRGLIQSNEISTNGLRQLLQLLARVGNADDLQNVFNYAQRDPELLTSLPAIAEARRLPPSGAVHRELEVLLKHENANVRSSAARLSGIWQQRQLIPMLQPIVDSIDDDQVRAAAIHSLAELAPDSAVKKFQPFIAPEHSPRIYLAALEAVARQDINSAAIAALRLLTELEDTKLYGPVLSTIMNRRGAAEAVAAALKEANVSVDDAKLISRWLSAAGHDNAELVNAMKARMGIKLGQTVPYDPALVRALAEEVLLSGDPIAGRQVFLSSLANCTACHRVQNVTTSVDPFPKGPDLTAVAAGLQLELIVESVIWPKRQIKEGFEMTTVVTDDGRVLSGYLTSENNGTVGLRDLATGKVRHIPTETIEERVNKGTAMPSGFTNSLTRKELRDLIAWLANRKGAGVEP